MFAIYIPWLCSSVEHPIHGWLKNCLLVKFLEAEKYSLANWPFQRLPTYLDPKVFCQCFWFKDMAIVNSAHRCSFGEAEKAVEKQLNWALMCLLFAFYQPRSGMVMQNCRSKKKKGTYGFWLIVASLFVLLWTFLQVMIIFRSFNRIL